MALFLKNPNLSYKQLAEQTGVQKSTAYRVIEKVKREGTVDHKTGPRKKRGPSDVEKTRNILADIDEDPTLSLRKLAQKHGLSSCTVHKIKRDRVYLKVS